MLRKEHVVILIRFERRIEVDEIDAFIADVPAKYVEVVAVKQCIHIAP
jgi:hypothetical protein